MNDQTGPVAAPLTEVEARILAAHIHGARPLVAAAYDDLARRSGDVGAADFKTVALGLLGGDAHAAALLRVDRAGYLSAYLAELATRGLIDLNAALRARIPVGYGPPAPALPVERIMPQDAGGRRIVAQGWTLDMAEWVDMSALTIGLAKAMRRICLVRVGGTDPAQGTGFLIGPQTVLTNWHVVHSLIDPATGAARPGSAGTLSCDFEHLGQAGKVTHQAVEAWLVDFSPLAPQAPGIRDPYPDMTAARGHALDFCAIRLAGAPGRMRGWYDLGQPGQIDNKAGLIFVLQHPAGLPHWPSCRRSPALSHRGPRGDP